jgi:hypothetical protein
MELKSKYNINDMGWYIDRDTSKCVTSKIVGIHADVKGSMIKKCGDKKDLIETGEFQPGEIKITYQLLTARSFGGNVYVDEEKLFPTKEELIATL